MTGLAVQGDVLPSVSHYLGNGLVLVKLPPVLVKIAKLKVHTPLDRTRVRFDFSQEQSQQSTLADTVIADKAYSVATANPQREILDQH